MQHRVALLAFVLTAGCASDVDLQLGLRGDGADGGSGISSSVGPLRAARVLSGPGTLQVTAVAWHSASLLLAGGHFNKTTDLGTGTVEGGDYGMGFVVAYDPTTGDTVWAHAFSGSSATDASYQLTTSYVEDIAVATDGTVYAVGSFGRTVDFGAGPIESTDGCHDGIVARYAPDGRPLPPFILRQAPLVAAAAMPDGGLMVSGYEAIGDCPVLDGGTPAQRILVRLDDEGNVVWKQSLGETPLIGSLATSADGDILLAGELSETVTFGDLSVTGIDPRVGDTFLARLTPDGDPMWLIACVRTALDGSQCSPTGSIAFTADGRVLAAGTFNGRVDLASEHLETSVDDTHRTASYVAEIDPDGNATVLAVVEKVVAWGVAARNDPVDLVLAGQGMNEDLKGPYVGVFADGGTLVSQRALSTAELSWGTAWDVASGPAGEIALVGAFHGEADFGDGPVHADTGQYDDGDDGFVAIYDRPEVN